jgi:phage tail sheath gpL-like
MAAIYVLNETGARIWRLIDGRRSLADIGDVLAQQYNVRPETVEADLLEIIGQLEELGMLRAVEHAM